MTIPCFMSFSGTNIKPLIILVCTRQRSHSVCLQLTALPGLWCWASEPHFSSPNAGRLRTDVFLLSSCSASAADCGVRSGHVVEVSVWFWFLRWFFLLGVWCVLVCFGFCWCSLSVCILTETLGGALTSGLFKLCKSSWVKITAFKPYLV